MNSESQDEDRKKRIDDGVVWLKKIFGNEQVTLVHKHNRDLIEVN